MFIVLKNPEPIEREEAEMGRTALFKSIDNFATDLYKCIADHEKGNFVFSGLSVHLSAAMCALGADENTAKETLDAIGINKDTIKGFKDFIVSHFRDVQNIELSVANGIFADKSLQVKDSFKERVRDFFLSDVNDVDFASQCEKSIEFINNWCAEKTKNKITNIVSEGNIGPLTKIILVNAVYFKADWLYEFDNELTRNKPFFIDAETAMNKSLQYRNLESFNAECVAIPYSNEDYYFVVIKPKAIDGLKQLEMNLHQIKINLNDRWNKEGCFEFRDIDLTLPKFKIESGINLNDHLKKLGMIEIFKAGGNLSGISDDKPLFVSTVLQKAKIDVNEKGTEAAAETEWLVAKGPCRPKQWLEFKVDRPFLYKVIEKNSNLTLFTGRIVKPTYD